MLHTTARTHDYKLVPLLPRRVVDANTFFNDIGSQEQCARYLAMAIMHQTLGACSSNAESKPRMWWRFGHWLHRYIPTDTRSQQDNPLTSNIKSRPVIICPTIFLKYFRSPKSSTNFLGWQILHQRSQRCACRFWPKRAPGSWALVLRDQRWPSRRSKRARIIIIFPFSMAIWVFFHHFPTYPLIGCSVRGSWW
jgi:hypothetical protein